MVPRANMDEDDWSQTPVCRTALSPRTVRALCGLAEGWDSLDTMGQVVRLTDRELLSRPGLGRAALAEIDAWLSERFVGRPRSFGRPKKG